MHITPSVPGTTQKQLVEHTLDRADIPPRREAEWGKGPPVMQRRKAPQLLRLCHSTWSPKGSRNTWRDAGWTLRVDSNRSASLQEEPTIVLRVKLWHHEIHCPRSNVSFHWQKRDIHCA